MSYAQQVMMMRSPTVIRHIYRNGNGFKSQALAAGQQKGAGEI
jgi:hypothetical protein